MDPLDRRGFLSLAAAGFAVAFLPRESLALSPPDSASKKKWAYLTFDDGPGGGTSRARAILEAQDIPGTFFVVGSRVRSQKDAVASMHRAGHSVQNHSWSHQDLRSHRDPKRDLARCSNIVEDVTGTRPTHFRPPYGATNKRVKRIGTSLGMTQMLWNLSATPPLAHRNPPVRFRERIDEVTAKGSGDYVVVLFHDGSGPVDDMLRLLPESIKGFKERGFGFAKF